MKKETNASEAFINESGLEFTDISSEKKREYTFPNGVILKIGKPLFLNVSRSGGHRLYTSKGWCYYVQPKEGWSIRWKVREGQPNFVK
jgi:hypothetical protein